ncbi:hypothetical protein [Paraburkholderia aromaticivorans]|uniref:hypothetical protein n=1 Tax=Paraburkholderia aromaticivorans TaxID=2026199 RepID=UPI0014562196|nr:hypothetical protein [Paraburkholderia aromaticivorans]
MSLSITDRFSIGGGLVGVAGLGFGFFSVNGDRAHKRIIRRQAKVFPETFNRLAKEYRKAAGIDDEPELLKLNVASSSIPSRRAYQTAE